MTVLLIVLGALAVFVGLVGTVLPAVPGAPLVCGGLILIAWGDGFTRVGAWPLVIIGLLALLAMVIDLLGTYFGVKRARASGWAVAGASLGLLLGVLLGPLGVLLGPFAGAALGEYYARRDHQQAMKAGIGAGVGLLLGAFARLALAFGMLGVFAAAWFLD